MTPKALPGRAPGGRRTVKTLSETRKWDPEEVCRLQPGVHVVSRFQPLYCMEQNVFDLGTPA